MENGNKKFNAQVFVKAVLGKLNETGKKDTAFAAKLRRGDNPETEDAAYEILANFNVNLEQDRQRLPVLLIGAALCRHKPEKDGSSSIGKALAARFHENRDQGDMRMRRLLACDGTGEICSVLRHLLPLLKDGTDLSYTLLLNNLLDFEHWDAVRQQEKRERIKLRWARDFYSTKGQNPDEDGEEDQASGPKKKKQSGNGKKSQGKTTDAGQATELNGFGE